MKSELVVQTCNPRTWGVETRELKFKASLGCIARLCFRGKEKEGGGGGGMKKRRRGGDREKM